MQLFDSSEAHSVTPCHWSGATLGQLQVSLGMTLPPSSLMATSICWISSGKASACSKVEEALSIKEQAYFWWQIRQLQYHVSRYTPAQTQMTHPLQRSCCQHHSSLEAPLHQQRGLLLPSAAAAQQQYHVSASGSAAIARAMFKTHCFVGFWDFDAISHQVAQKLSR